MELKEAIQKIKELLSVETPEAVVEPVVEVEGGGKNEPEAAAAPEAEPVVDKFDAEAFKTAIMADFDAKLEAIKADFAAKLEAIEAKNKEGHSKIAEILEQVAETPAEQPSEAPKTMLSETAAKKHERVAKAADAMKQYRELNKK
jgi:predicted phage gp36 major capsid-like protein